MNRLLPLRSVSAGLLAIIVLATHAGSAAAAAPDTTITGGPSGLIASRSATFSFVSTVAGSTFKCKLDAKDWVTCISPRTYTKLTQGAHTFRVKAKKGSAVDKTPAVRTFTVNTAVPDTTITRGPTGTTLDIRPEFTFRSTPTGSTFECSVDAAAFTACTSPFNVPPPYLHTPHTFQVRAKNAAGNVDATPAARTFTVEPINLGGQPFADAAADLYFPASVDLDVPAVCTSQGTDCPGGTPLPPSSQVRLQTTDLSVVFQPGANRYDVTATIAAQTLQGISLQLVGSNCTLTFAASQGSLSNWTAQVSLQFTYDQTNGDVNITPGTLYVTGVESQDWQLTGDVLCLIGNIYNNAGVASVLAATIYAYWETVGWPLCEKPAPALVGSCPSWGIAGS